MIVGVGLDVADTRRMERLLRRFDDAVLDLVFTRRELAAVRRWSDPAQRLALSFGVKEACGKALGTGLAGIRWTDIEAAEVDGAAVRPSFTGAAQARADLLGARCWRAWWSPLGGAGRSPLGGAGRSPLGGAEADPAPLLVVAAAASDPADLRGLDVDASDYATHPTHRTHRTTTKGSRTWQATSTSRPW